MHVTTVVAHAPTLAVVLALVVVLALAMDQEAMTSMVDIEEAAMAVACRVAMVRVRPDQAHAAPTVRQAEAVVTIAVVVTATLVVVATIVAVAIVATAAAVAATVVAAAAIVAVAVIVAVAAIAAADTAAADTAAAVAAVAVITDKTPNSHIPVTFMYNPPL